MADKYPHRLKGMTDQEVDANESRRPKNNPAYDLGPSEVINNDFHPSDKGLNAEHEDHWGTELNTMIQNDEKRRKGYE